MINSSKAQNLIIEISLLLQSQTSNGIIKFHNKMCGKAKENLSFIFKTRPVLMQ